VAELEEADRRNLRWLWWLRLLLALIGIGIGAYVLLTPKKVAVPDVVGRRSATAAQILQNEGFEVNVENVRSDDVPADRVTTQRPQPKEEADEGSTVTIIVSSGPGEATIPFVRGSPQDEATKKLKAAGFKVDVRKESNEDVAKGKVIETSPAEGQQLTRGTSVTLVVSRGPQQVQVPDVVGKNRDDAAAQLQDLGLRVSFTEREDATKDPGTVLEMSPAAGSHVDKGATVTLTVAKAPKQVAVPDVAGEQANDAERLLKAAGFTVKRRKRTVDSPEGDDVVLETSPPAGEKRDKGSRVTITVGRFTPENLDPDPSATATPSPTP
jgi:serine/threonine-protein kinase